MTPGGTFGILEIRRKTEQRWVEGTAILKILLDNPVYSLAFKSLMGILVLAFQSKWVILVYEKVVQLFLFVLFKDELNKLRYF